MTARDEILARIRAAAPNSGEHDTGEQHPAEQDPAEQDPAEPESIPREYVQKGSLPDDARAALFVERLRDYGSGVYPATLAAVRASIEAILRNRRIARIAVPAGLPPEWIPAGLAVIVDEDLDYALLDSVDGVITTCTLAIAATGTIVLQHGAGQGRRALTLIPDYHLCIVRLDQLVETVPEAIRRSNPALPTTTISGPSATSDIEMTRIKGVHGPRTLDVILAGYGPESPAILALSKS